MTLRFSFLKISSGAVEGIPAARRAEVSISSLGVSNVERLWGESRGCNPRVVSMMVGTPGQFSL